MKDLPKGETPTPHGRKPEEIRGDTTNMNPIEKKIRKAGGEMISRPLFDDHGEVDPMAEAELMEALEKASPRGAANQEWLKPVWTFKHEIVAAFAKCACAQSPYGVPDGLENVCKYLHAALATVHHPKWNADGMAMVSLNWITERLYEILYEQGVKEFDAWNERKNKREGIGFVSRDFTPSPDDDFIDLDALLRNVCIVIRDDRRAFDKFNADFDAEQKAPPVSSDEMSNVPIAPNE